MLLRDAARVVYAAVWGEELTDNLEHGGRKNKGEQQQQSSYVPAARRYAKLWCKGRVREDHRYFKEMRQRNRGKEPS